MKRLRYFVLVLSAAVLTTVSSFVDAQSGVIILCDPTFDLAQESLPSPFPGAYYLASADPDLPVIPISFQRITNSGSDQPQSPIPTSTAQNLRTPIVSPDGLLMAFIPRLGTPLFVWDLETNETTSIMLPQDEADYITGDYTPYVAYRSRLQWRTSRQLVIPFTDERGQVISETTITVSEDPLQLTYSHQLMNYPPITPPAAESNPVFVHSPNGNYTALLTLSPVLETADRRRVRLYNSSNEIVFDYPPTASTYPISFPVWTSDESTLFIIETNNTGRGTRLVEVSLGTPSIVVDTLNSTLESAFGVNYRVSLVLHPTLSNDGNSIAFLITQTTQGKDYIIFYNTTTDEIRAVCNEEEIPISPDYFYTFWSPDDQYFGYWTYTGFGRPIIFSKQTGDVFRLPSTNAAFFVGWAQAPAPTSAEATQDE